MDLNGKNAGAVTPGKDSKSTPSKVSKKSENINPNVTSTGLNILKSPAIKSSKKPQKSAPRNPNPTTSPSPRNKIRERKFVVARKNSKREKPNSSTATCKCKVVSGNSQKCLCVAYENLRASQEEFFKNRRAEIEFDEEENKTVIQNPNFAIGLEGKLGEDEIESSNQMSSVNVKRKSLPEPRSGTVMHLIKAFEKLSSLPKSENSDQTEEKDSKDWALPGLQPRVSGTQVSSSSFCLSDFSLTLENLGLDSRVSSSLDSTRGSFSISSRTSGGGRRSSLDGRHSKRRQHRVTSQKPFQLRTEQRGRSKEEEFIKKVQQMMTEEEKQRIPVAQGLPLTTDEPECLAKPPVKESTRPVDLVLHSDVRALERSEFDHQVAAKMSFIEQYKMEKERQQKLAEEEEIRRLRKELVPRAQPMPYFDRPFIPRRSVQHPTMPKEPKFHMLPQHKKIKSCMSWNDIMYTHQL